MKKLLVILLFLVSRSWAAIPTFQSFNPTQFPTNGLMIAYDAVHTNDNGIIYPAQVNSLTLDTNLNVYGTFSLPAKITVLNLGTNYLDMSTNTTWLLNSPTNDATQVILSLSAGAYQGQFALITSQNGAESFTLPDQSEQWDVPGAVVWLSGLDWIGTTNRGILLQYTAPDWVAIERFDPSGGGGGSVLGSGTSPFLPYWTGSTTLGNSPIQRLNSEQVKIVSGGNSLTLGMGSGSGVIGANASLQISAGTGVLTMLGGQYLTPSVGGIGMTLGVDTNYFGGLFLGTNGLFGVYTDNGTTLLRDGVPIGGGGGGTTINPTDGYLPYRLSSTTFSNSQWYVINSKSLGFTSTNFFLTYTNFNLGVGGNTLAALTGGSGNIALGANAMQSANGGINNVAIGTSTLTSVTSDNNVAIGQSSGNGVSSGSQNVLIGGNTGLALGTGVNSVMVGFQAGLNSTVGENTFVGYNAGNTNTTGNYDTFIGWGANGLTATDTNSIVIGARAIGKGSNTAVIGDANVSALYLGNTRINPLKDLYTSSSQFGFGSESVTPTNIYSGNLSAGITDLFTVPSGKRFNAITVIISTTNLTANTAYELFKTNSVYYRYSSDATVGTNSPQGLGFSADDYLFEAGEVISVTNSLAGANVRLFGLLFSTNMPMYSPRLLSLNVGNNTLYTCPAGKCAVRPTSPNFNPTLFLQYMNDSGENRTNSLYVVPSGGSVASSNIIWTRIVATKSTTSASCGILFPGDSIVVDADANASGKAQTVRMTVVEIPFP